MDLKTYRAYVELTIRHLKKKYTNLSAEEAHKMAADIVDEMIFIEDHSPDKQSVYSAITKEGSFKVYGGAVDIENLKKFIENK